MKRRALLIGGGAALMGAALPLSRLFVREKRGRPGRFGPLRPDPEGILDLPEGFSYRVLERRHDLMNDGFRVPGLPDGMACFGGPDGTLVLMRNHECGHRREEGPYRSGQEPPAQAFARDAFGGVTRLVIDAGTLERVSSNLVLTGTLRNCAGGISPWGWLSCEESMEAGHGYVFLCSTTATSVDTPRRIGGYGRFRHEAAVVDPRTSIAYLTEDQPDGCLYRFVPSSRDEPFQGQLQAMRLTGHDRFNTGHGVEVGQAFDVDWVDIEHPTPAGDTVRTEAHRKGAAIVRRGEGLWYDGGVVYLTATTGGPARAGQVFRLTLGQGSDPDRLDLLAQSTDANVLDMPDNLTVAPWGELYLAEDSVAGAQYIRGLDPEGQLFDFARNALSTSELAGVCFSPDGGTLFVNIYGDGLTLAIRGPFQPA